MASLFDPRVDLRTDLLTLTLLYYIMAQCFRINQQMVKKMRYMLLGTFVVVLLTGCTKDSGIIRVDGDKYFISIQSPQVSFGPPVEQKAEVYRQANDFCEKDGLVLETIELREVNQVFGRHGSAHLTFRCVPESGE